MNPREFFSKEYEIDGTFKGKDLHIKAAVIFIKKEFGIKTTKDELMIDIKSKIIPTLKGTVVRKGHFLTIEPTQELLKKFMKDYPEFLV